jgi:hypothetical protein
MIQGRTRESRRNRSKTEEGEEGEEQGEEGWNHTQQVAVILLIAYSMTFFDAPADP